MKITPLFLGNWKMHMRPEEVTAFADSFIDQFVPNPNGVADAGFAAPFTSLPALRDAFVEEAGIRLGAQNVHWLETGAHTGEISAPMLRDWNVDFVIVGHSERRQFYGENDAHVALRAKNAIAHEMTAVVCIGETQQEFQAGSTLDVVSAQLRGSTAGIEREYTGQLIIAYEPVWAIGTGLAATPEIAAGVHDHIRRELLELFGEAGETVPILYGGSTKPENVYELLQAKNINGALVGGASLLPDVFCELVERAREGNERS